MVFPTPPYETTFDYIPTIVNIDLPTPVSSDSPTLDITTTNMGVATPDIY